MAGLASPDSIQPFPQAEVPARPVEPVESVAENASTQPPPLTEDTQAQKAALEKMLQEVGMPPPETPLSELPSTVTEIKTRQSLLSGFKNWIANLFHLLTGNVFRRK